MEKLLAGVKRVNINPPIGIKRPGIRLFADPIQSIESDLTVTALVLEHNGNKIAIIACDLALIPIEDDKKWREIIGKEILQVFCLIHLLKRMLIGAQSQKKNLLIEFLKTPIGQNHIDQYYNDITDEVLLDYLENQGIEISDIDAREHVYGMPYPEWKKKYQK